MTNILEKYIYWVHRQVLHVKPVENGSKNKNVAICLSLGGRNELIKIKNETANMLTNISVTHGDTLELLCPVSGNLMSNINSPPSFWSPPTFDKYN